ncbi:uncharacterized protein YgiM (DUF1202 family) [Sagittula marina]|uniref:Uncharacterized protein YgiM (DUF1202 family) n=1 Tax=Sagittula marina TaxID=943940 RepID=A0A7W6DMZ5_9RHOB|nr:SH3 domain-containing protein [Sagittula marina]MBB3984476.1 uncharacterized protein YgiM (DUF1202 family) [Sagittula marina]
MSLRLPFFMSIVLSVCAVPALAAQGVIDTPRGTTVEMRNGPAAAFDIERLLRDGTVVDILSDDPAGMWVEVRGPSGATGWIPRSKLEDPEQEAENTLRRSADRPDWIRRDASDDARSARRDTVTNTPTRSAGRTTTAGGFDRDASGRETLYVNSPSAGALNLRSGPGTNYNILDQLAHGDQVVILGGSAPWRRVRAESGWTGYVYGTYLSATPPDQLQPPRTRPTDPPSAGRVVDTLWVDAPQYGGLNLRAGPGTSYDIRETMDHRSRVELLEGGTETWKLLRSDTGEVGFAHVDYLSENRPPRAVPSADDRRQDWPRQRDERKRNDRNVLRVTPEDLPRILAECAFSGDNLESCVVRELGRGSR